MRGAVVDVVTTHSPARNERTTWSPSGRHVMLVLISYDAPLTEEWRDEPERTQRARWSVRSSAGSASAPA